METLKTIVERRSIRKFKNKDISRDKIKEILELAIKAPSGKNRQPWRFVILKDKNKNKLKKIMTQKTKYNKKKQIDIGSSEISTRVVSEAPVVVLVFNSFSKVEENYIHNKLLVDIQSIGAAIQTLVLSAQDMGLATLWICDILYSKDEISSWLNTKDELVAAVAIGHADQSPFPRPRKNLEDVVDWLE
ncbi:MAG: nitroreductase [Firmicutes bacterium]|nr:nitroreductase [Bacillota bacterium]